MASLLQKIEEFETLERKLFLKKYYDYSQTQEVLGKLTKPQYNIIISETESGIKEGIDRFLKKQPVCEKYSANNLYLSNLAEFEWDNSIQEAIHQKLRLVTDISKRCKKEFSEDVCQTYRAFVYNESYKRFQKQFPKADCAAIILSLN